MPAGINCAVSIIRNVFTSDDDVGGAYPSGTYLHQNLDARLEEDSIDSAFFQQGLETIKTFSAMVWGHALDIREQDKVEVVSPPNHRYFGKRFRIVDCRYDSRHPALKQDYVLLKMTRSQEAHGENFQ